MKMLLAYQDHTTHGHEAATGAAHVADHAGHAHADPKPIDHVVDVILAKINGIPVLTMHMLTLVAATLLMLWVMSKAAKSISTGPDSLGAKRYVAKGRLGQLIEGIVLYLRDEMIQPMLGPALTRRYLPFLLSIFFFILFNNLLGLAPLTSAQHLIGGYAFDNWHWAIIGGTATGNIAVTAALAIIAFIVIQAHGIKELGIGGWLHHLLGGAPWWLAPLMIPVELMGMIIKPCALAIRLFANMLAGHTLMATLLLFGFMALRAGLGAIGGGGIGVLSGLFATAIFFMELFVAFLQAFVFMFLTTVFISQLTHHDEEHGHEHDAEPDQHGHEWADPVPGGAAHA